MHDLNFYLEHALSRMATGVRLAPIRDDAFALHEPDGTVTIIQGARTAVYEYLAACRRVLDR
ncbi:MAG TPA: hypothetical protein VI113_00840 [Alphaproteobacteria bacterium]